MLKIWRAFWGTLYKTFASWQRFGDRSAQGETAAGMLGLISSFLLGAVIHVVAPTTIDRWLSLSGPAKLLTGTIAILPVAVFFQSGGRGWRWAKEAEELAPGLSAYGNWIAILTIAIAITLAFIITRYGASH